MFENQAKTLFFKTNEEAFNAFDKLEARISEMDNTLTSGDILAWLLLKKQLKRYLQRKII